jgi:nucleoside-diphosphate-sugar epimerase
VVHQLTDIPRAINPRRFGEQFATNDRLRVEGTRNLVEAAREAGARRVIAQSVAFAYAPGGRDTKHEDDPLFLDAPFPFRRSVEAIGELERTVTQTDGIEGIVLRYGYFYGPGTPFAPDGSTAQMVRRRRYPIVGSGEGSFSFIHVDDAAEAAVTALDRGATGIYNVVDEDPARVRDWLPIYADALDAPAPRHVPALLARLLAGRWAVDVMTEQRGASNQKAKAELGWEPRWTTWRKGFREALG